MHPDSSIVDSNVVHETQFSLFMIDTLFFYVIKKTMATTISFLSYCFLLHLPDIIIAVHNLHNLNL